MSATQILVVEDEKLVATAIQNELEQFGYQVSGIASSSKDAIDKAGRHRPDLVLMDIHLQGESDGIETARCIYDRYQIPVVYLSAFSDPETVARASETNAYGFLLKPYEEQELQTTIEMAVAKRRAEAKLEETERWLAAIHNGITEAVIAVDPEQRIRFLNPAAAALTGWPIEEAIGMPIETVCNLVSSAGRIVIENVANKVTATSRPSELPEGCWVVSKHDLETPVEGSVLAIRDPRGDLLGTVVSLRDISSRLELNRLRKQAEEKRRHAEKMESVSRLAGGLADHLNNLMTVILGNTSLSLTQTPDETEACGLMRQVEVAAQHAAALVQRLMLFSTLSGRKQEAPANVNLNRFIPSCLKDVNLRLDPEIALSYKPDPDLWHVAADDLQLGHVLYELALNSQEAMPEGGRICLQAENIALSEADLAAHPAGHVGEFVRLKISDTGTGMSPAVRAHMFEPCFTTKTRGSAAGLGLALIAAIVEQQHGWIECQSQLRHGTQFEIYLPRYRSEAPADSTGSQSNKPRGATPTILLAEPDPMVRDLGRRILEAEGYRVLLAEDGVQSVNIFQEEPHQIDLAILDLNIPKLTPYAVLERLVELDPHVRVLFSGGYFTEDLTNTDGHTMGVITKPYHHDELIQMVRHSLARHSK